MSRGWKITAVVSLLLNALLLAGVAWYVSERGARAVAEDLGVVEPRRPAFDFYAEEQFKGLPGADVVLLGDSQVDLGDWSEVLGQPVANRGQYGARISEVTETLDWTLVGHPEHVVIWAGTNDAVDGPDPSGIETDMRDLLAEIDQRAPDAAVAVLSLPPVKWGSERIEPANEAMQRAVEGTDAQWIDVTGPLAGAMVNDGLHVSGEGYVVVAQALKDVLSEPHQ